MIKNFKKFKLLPVFLLVAVGVFLFSAQGAEAAAHEGTCWFNPACWIGGILSSVLYLIIQALGWILGSVAALANWALSPPGGGSIIRDDVVTLGWRISRDFANMFFILILLGIALDFILFNSFKVKQMIPRLLLIALLINFSLPIAGVVIDFANVFTQFFIGKMTTAGKSDVTEGIAQSLNLAELYTGKNVGGVNFTSANVTGALILNMVFAIIFTFGTIFIFLAMALMFFIRTGYLYILLTILPIVLVLYAFPPTSRYFGQWSNKFISWTMFAPVATFFIYLAATYLDSATSRDFTKMLDNQKIGYLSQIYTYIIAWVFLGGALVVGQQMGIKLGKISMDSAKTMNKWTRGKLSSAGKGVATSTGRALKADEQMSKLALGIQKAVPGWLGGGMLASGVRGLGVKTKTAMEKREEPTAAEKAEWTGLSDMDLAKEQEIHEESKLPGSGAKAAHIAAMRAKKGKLQVLDPSGEVDIARTEALVRSSYEAAKAHGNKAAMQTILQSAPLIARKINIEEWDMDKREGKLITATDSRTGTLTQRNRKTGKTFADAQRDVFDISRADFANMKGQWNEASVKEFIESGHLTKMHLKEAEEISDGDFPTFVREYYANIDGMAAGSKARTDAIANIKKLNPGLTNTYISGSLADVSLGQPKDASTWETATQTSGGAQQKKATQKDTLRDRPGAYM